MSQAEFGLCNVVFGRALIPEQADRLNAHKADDPPALSRQNILLLHFYVLIPDSYIYFTLVPLSHIQPRRLLAFLILNSYLSLPGTEGNKMLLLWKLLTERGERERGSL